MQIRSETQQLKVKLRDYDLVVKARELAQVLEQLDEQGAHEALARAEWKQERARLEKRRSELAQVVREGHEVREIPVAIHADWQTMTAVEIRKDTGEVVNERALTAEERESQQSDFLRDDAKAIDQAVSEVFDS